MNERLIEEVGQDDVESMERALMEQQRHVQMAREKLKQKKEEEERRRVLQLKTKLEELNRQITSEQEGRRQLFNTMLELEKKEDSSAMEQLEAEREIWHLDRERHLEEVARQRIILEEIREKQKILGGMMERNAVHLDEIDQEKRRRNQAEGMMVTKLVEKADMLKKELEAQEKDLIKIAERSNYAVAKRRLLDEIEPERRRKLNERLRIIQEELRTVNAQRSTLMDKEMELIRNRKQCAAMVKKGPEYLVQVELNQVDPEPEIAAEDDDLPAAEPSMDEMIEYAKTCECLSKDRISTQEKAIKAMDEDLIQVIGRDPSHYYDSSWSVTNYKPNQKDKVELSRRLLLEIVDKVAEVGCSIRDVDTIHREQQRWRERKIALEKQREEIAEDGILREVSFEILDEACMEIIYDVWNELQSINTVTFHIASTACSSAVMIKPMVEAEAILQQTLVSAFQELRRQRTLENSMVLQFHRRKQKLVRVSTRLKTSNEGGTEGSSSFFSGFFETKTKDLQDGRRKKRAFGSMQEDGISAGGGAASAILAEEQEDCIYFGVAERLKLVREQAPIMKEYAEQEFRYWSLWTFERFAFNLPSASGNISALAMALNGRYLAAGTNVGQLAVWDISKSSTSPTLLRWLGKPSKENRTSIAALRFSMDGSTVATITENRIVLIWGLYQSPMASKFMEDPLKYSPLEPELLVRLTEDNFRRQSLLRPALGLETKSGEGQSKNAESMGDDSNAPSVTPTFAGFHPAMTVLGHPQAILIGTRGGVVVKYSYDMTAPTMGTLVYGKTAAGKDILSESNAAVKGLGAVSRGSNRREFFEAHRSPVLFVTQTWDRRLRERMSCPLSSPLLVSIDKNGLLCYWAYHNSFYSGFGWFHPSLTIQFDFLLPHYEAVPNSRTKIFPPKNLDVAKHVVRPEKDRTFVAASRRAEELLKASPLIRRPWKIEPTKSGGEVKTFATRTIDSIGREFYIATYTAKGQLVKLETEVYRGSQEKGSLVSVKPTTSNNELVLMVQYEPSSERADFVYRFFVFSLNDQAIFPSVITITERPSRKPHYAVTPVLDALGCDYLIVLTTRSTSIYSLMTGHLVATVLTADPVNFGSRLMKQEGSDSMKQKLAKDFTLLAAGCQSSLLNFATTELDSSTVMLCRLMDKNTSVTREEAAQRAFRTRRMATPSEFWMRRLRWDIDSENVYKVMIEWIWSLVDVAVATSDAKQQAAVFTRRPRPIPPPPPVELRKATRSGRLMPSPKNQKASSIDMSSWNTYQSTFDHSKDLGLPIRLALPRSIPSHQPAAGSTSPGTSGSPDRSSLTWIGHNESIRQRGSSILSDSLPPRRSIISNGQEPSLSTYRKNSMLLDDEDTPRESGVTEEDETAELNPASAITKEALMDRRSRIFSWSESRYPQQHQPRRATRTLQQEDENNYKSDASDDYDEQ